MEGQKCSIGFVPTMGTLHEGHLSLIRSARDECDKLIVSIFVNPMQFDREDDLAAYPQQLETDIDIVKKEKVDVVFAPCKEEIYPEGFCTRVELKKLTENLCGKRRPGHFEGVATIITKLFNIVKPDRAYLGQKDYQQYIIIKRLVQDLNMGIDIKLLPTVRDKDGLALSSRNRHLSAEERIKARCLYEALLKAKSLVRDNQREVEKIKSEMEGIILHVRDAKIDYISIVDSDTLIEKTEVSGDTIAAVAVWIGSTRLIDNIVIDT
ncbi:MAG: pantothenate synthetase [Candidatus Scalindua sp.]|nr:MAG: pantothenate synthetase [Candidatus Scalindua sp.]